MEIKVEINLPNDYCFESNIFQIVETDFSDTLPDNEGNYLLMEDKIFIELGLARIILDFYGRIVIRNKARGFLSHEIDFMIHLHSGVITDIYEYRKVSKKVEGII